MSYQSRLLYANLYTNIPNLSITHSNILNNNYYYYCLTLFAFFYTINLRILLSMKFSAKKLFLIGFVVLLLVGIPVTIYLLQQQQEIRSRATPATTLYFEPDSSGTPINAAVGQSIPLDLYIDPGSNLVTSVKLEIQYDSDRLSVAEDAFQANSAAFPSILSGPIYSPNKIQVSMSVGVDLTKSISTRTRVATITFKAVSNTTDTSPTQITFSGNTVVTSSSSQDEFSENVLASTNPARILIGSTSQQTPTDPPQVTEPPAQATATPGPTTGATPTISTTPSATGMPICSALTADTLAGAAPLTVNFTANGNDEDGTITKATFNFGDGQVSDVTEGGGIGTNAVNVPLAHTYTTAGTFQATALLTDDIEGISDSANCTQTITVQGESSIATATPTIPPAGAADTLMGFGAIAAFLMVAGTLIFFMF